MYCKNDNEYIFNVSICISFAMLGLLSESGFTGYKGFQVSASGVYFVWLESEFSALEMIEL